MPGTTDTVKAILTPGEFVIRKEAVDMIGAPMLNMINNMPEKGGHSNIDSLIEKATMANMKGMYGGGMVQAGPKPMGTGGMVDAYAGGGMVMDQMEGYQKGGLSKLISLISPKAKRQELYSEMVPQDMQEDALPLDQMSSLSPLQKQMGQMENLEYLDNLRSFILMQRIKNAPNPKADPYMKGGKVKKNLKPVPQGNSGLGKLPEAVRNKMGYMQEGGEVQESLMGMMYGGMANKKKKGYQEGGMIGPALPPEMMGQAMNQQLSESIDMRMQNPQAGGSIGVARDQAMALQDSINMNTVDSARKSLQLLRLQSLLSEGGDTLNFEGSMMPPNQEMESARARDLLEFLKMQTMQRGMGSVRQGMGDEPMRAIR